jgi:hypothetical protein
MPGCAGCGETSIHSLGESERDASASVLILVFADVFHPIDEFLDGGVCHAFVGVACQCFSPGENQTTSPGRISSIGRRNTLRETREDNLLCLRGRRFVVSPNCASGGDDQRAQSAGFFKNKEAQLALPQEARTHESGQYPR